MLGAIIGDMVGSLYEFNPIKTKEFDIFNKRAFMTDDSYLTLAVARVLINKGPFNHSDEWIKDFQKALVDEFVATVKKHPHAGYGGRFYRWATSKEHKPYNSFGNGSAMRISPVGWYAKSVEEIKILSKVVSEVTHNHPEGIKGAEAVAIAIYLARTGKTKSYISKYIVDNYYPEIESFNYDDLVRHYSFDETCQGSVPQAIYAFLISNSLEDAIRTCIAIGGDCDTTAAIAGSIAEAYYKQDQFSPFEQKFFEIMLDKETQNEILVFNKFIKWSERTKKS